VGISRKVVFFGSVSSYIMMSVGLGDLDLRDL
jgi:hypothetical protein